MRRLAASSSSVCIGLNVSTRFCSSLSSIPITCINLDNYNKITPVDDAPKLSFLQNSSILPETVDETIAKSTELLDLLPNVSSVSEKHDIIDSVSNILCLLLDPCEMVRQIHPDEDYKEQATLAFSRGYEFMCETNSRVDLYQHLLEMTEHENALDDEQRKNAWQLRRDMEKNGIHMPGDVRMEISQLNIEHEKLSMKLVVDEQTGGNPYGTLRDLLNCRQQLAKRLGFECFADRELKGTMLNSREQVWHFLCAVANKYRPNADTEVRRLQQQQGEVRARTNLTDEDRGKLSVNLRRQYEPEGVEQYFTVANCVRGIQCLCSEVFGVRLERVPFDVTEILHQDAKKFHAFDASGKLLGVIVLDMFARSTKRCQAGHITVQLGCQPHTELLSRVDLSVPPLQYPIVVLTCNAGSQVRTPRRSDGTIDAEGTFMLPHEVRTAFHEFGHALHTIFGQTKVQNLAGTRGSIDFVESFSQLFEQFLGDPDFLRLWARRYGTGEPIPHGIVHRSNEVINMFRHLDTIDQVVLASVDQTLHGPEPFTVYFPSAHGQLAKRTLGSLSDYGRGIYSLSKLMVDICEPITPVTPTANGVLRTFSMEHLATYPAGYYGYLYSGAFAKRIWNKNFSEQSMNRDAGLKLKDEVMRYGAACDARQVISNYLQEDIKEIEQWI